MITAKQLLANNLDGLKDIIKDDDIFEFYKGVVCEYAKELAKLHCIEQAKVISENAKTKTHEEYISKSGEYEYTQYIDKDSILNAYSLDNIK